MKEKNRLTHQFIAIGLKKNNAAPMVKGGYWKDIVVLGPEGMDPPSDVKNKAKAFFLQYLKKEMLRLEKNGFQTEEILEIINCLESQTYLIKHKTEHEMQRYGAPSKNRMLGDLLTVELGTTNKIQFLVRDGQKASDLKMSKSLDSNSHL